MRRSARTLDVAGLILAFALFLTAAPSFAQSDQQSPNSAEKRLERIGPEKALSVMHAAISDLHGTKGFNLAPLKLWTKGLWFCTPGVTTEPARNLAERLASALNVQLGPAGKNEPPAKIYVGASIPEIQEDEARLAVRKVKLEGAGMYMTTEEVTLRRRPSGQWQVTGKEEAPAYYVTHAPKAIALVPYSGSSYLQGLEPVLLDTSSGIERLSLEKRSEKLKHQ